MNDNISELKEAEKTYEDKTYPTLSKGNNNVVVAGVMILVGAVLLIGNITGNTFENWWALFMLIPVGFMFMAIQCDYQENGRLTRKSSGAIIPAVILLAMVAIFLFDLSWSIFWPVSLVAVGMGMLLNGRS